MLVVPVQAVDSQTLTVTLAGQAVRLNIFAKSTGLFMDVLVNDQPIILGVLCLDAVRIVRDAYLGFIGDFAWFDTQGQDDPQVTGLGARWFLAYLEAS